MSTHTMIALILLLTKSIELLTGATCGNNFISTIQNHTTDYA